MELTGLMGAGSNSDTDEDRPPLSEADERRRANKQRSKVKHMPSPGRLQEFKTLNEAKLREKEIRKKNKRARLEGKQ